MSQLELDEDDQVAVFLAKKMARRFLKEYDLTPEQVIGLGKALYALDQLPELTPGANIEFGLCYSASSHTISETRCRTFRITEDSFEISVGGFIEMDGCLDSISEPGWAIEASGFKEHGFYIYALEDELCEYLNLGADITVDDESYLELP